ncbi:alpha/beta hydrolase [Streptomyces sp. NBC_00638]|uniref:RBBP9/YdeN family alpha/beta hydrolase n=1 Tax=unclassified Streptomyces TaxID=2593676 RepID=UPI00224E063C|nr:alpha/beta fold hydrolase [Streptomyces sp. NBC_00638]MCX5001413.1 alpha/beta hydrolase [Streptomyces sp. NBC_00638]
MSATSDPVIVIVPGLRDHVADHWQTLLAERLAEAGRTVRTVPPLTQDALSREARVAALDKVVSEIDGPVVLVAHSAGVITTVHWAHGSTAQVRGALLVTPPDFDTPLPEGYPGPEVLGENGWTPVPRTPLPFPSVVAASSNDPLGTVERVTALARDWGGRLVDLGEVGHLNPASGYGPWPRAEELLREVETG